MEGFLSLLATLDPSTQAGYNACLAAFRKLYPEGVVDDSQGQVILTVNGKTVRISGDLMYNVGLNELDAGQLVAGWFSVPPPPSPAPAPQPNASDAWRNLPPGTPVTIDGVNYVTKSLISGATMLCKRKSPPPAPVPTTVVKLKADAQGWVTATLMAEENEEAQAILLRFLDWLAKQ